jgi:hypothetical protein
VLVVVVRVMGVVVVEIVVDVVVVKVVVSIVEFESFVKFSAQKEGSDVVLVALVTFE